MENPPRQGVSSHSPLRFSLRGRDAVAASVALIGGMTVLMAYFPAQSPLTAAAGLVAAWALGRGAARQSIRNEAIPLAQRLSRSMNSPTDPQSHDADPLFQLSLAAETAAERLSTHGLEQQILQEALEGINEGVVLIGADHRVSYVNRAFTLQTEISRKSAVGRDYAALLQSVNNGALEVDIWGEVAKHHTWCGEAKWTLPSAGDEAFYVRLSVVKVDDRVRSYVALHRDTSAIQDLENEQQAFAQNLLRVHRIGQRVVETLDIAQLPERVVTGVADGFGMTARLWFLSENGLGLDRVAEAGPYGHACKTTVKMGEALPGLAALQMEHLVAASADALSHESPRASGNDQHHVAYPLRKSGELLAVLEVSAEGPLTGRPLETLRLLAQVAAEAISNARLHQHTAAQAASLELLSHQLVGAHQNEQAHRQEVENLNEKLMSADQLKNQFLNTTSHELRTPLSSILGYLDLILDDHAQSHEEEVEFVGEARRCAEHLLHLINDILDISRIEAGNLSIVPSSIDIHTLMDDVRSTVAPQVRQKGLELMVRCESDLVAFADFRRARQALINLTDNAIKFTENGKVTLSACAEGESIKITVSDTGIGVSSEDRGSVFEPFFQSDSGNNRAYPGTGLGLAITRRLVELMGGVVMLENDSNPSGSTFSITLPTTEVSEPMRLKPVVSS